MEHDKECINVGVLSAAKWVREAEKTLLATSDEYANLAADLAGKVKSKTPNPMMVRAGIRLVLKDNAFDIQHRRFVAQGSSTLRSIGLSVPVTRLVNTFANKGIEAGEGAGKSFALKQVHSLISEVLHKKRVPKQVADQAADGLVAAIA